MKMLHWSPDQFSVLEATALNDFHERLSKHLWVAFPQTFEKHLKTKERSALMPVIDRMITLANKYGFEDEHDITRFCEYICEYGPNFVELPWAQKVLSDAGLTSIQKLDRLSDYTVFVLR